MANGIIIEPSANNVILEPSHNSITVETIYIWTDYYFLNAAQVLPEHKEVET